MSELHIDPLELLKEDRSHRAHELFENPWDVEGRELSHLLRWRWQRMLGRKERGGAGVGQPAPTFPNNGRELRENTSADTITWIGHATLLLQLNGLNIITDPIFRSLPGRKRRSAPGVAPEDMPKIDVVLISHNHLDHLDRPALNRLPGNPRILTGLRLGTLVRNWGFRQVEELDWWHSLEIGSVKFTFLPAQHWSMRKPWDRDKTLWGSWMISTGDAKYYFGGDTGYFPGFKDIGAIFNDIDYAFLPIGASMPRWFMKPHHMSPEDAGRAFIDLGAKRLLPIHWGTYTLGDDLLDVPPRRMKQWYREYGPQDTSLIMPTAGRTLWLSENESLHRRAG